MRAWLRSKQPGLLASLIYAFVRLIGFTLRMRTQGDEQLNAEPNGKIIAGWHGCSFFGAAQTEK